MPPPAEQEFIEVKSPIDRFKDQWKQQPGPVSFLRQCKIVQQNPELLQYAELARIKGWNQPLMFGLQGLLLSALLLSAMNLWITWDKGKQTDDIAALQVEEAAEMKRQQGVIDATQAEIARVAKSPREKGFAVGASGASLSREEALQQLAALIEETHRSEREYRYAMALKRRDLRAAGDATALAGSGTPLVFSLALFFAAPLFKKFLQNDYRRFKLTNQAGDYYLYCMVPLGIWLNAALVALLNFALSGGRYGLGGLFEGVGPVGAALFWSGVYALLLYWMWTASKDLYKAMHIPPPATYFGLENRVLFHAHNSFWLVFLVLEAGLLALSYGAYLLEKNIG